MAEKTLDEVTIMTALTVVDALIGFLSLGEEYGMTCLMFVLRKFLQN